MAKVTTNISIKDLDALKELSQLLLTIMSDERIDEVVRNEYVAVARKVLNITSPSQLQSAHLMKLAEKGGCCY